ncbi:DNA mismatch repair protein Mlh3 [Engraulis encrasicolus]|uniref:DNA mismatch repair protein Mlh3 n=1 Tax=Engraulis encrasicolus TaxID=184585 RepID=UPI002FD0192D
MILFLSDEVKVHLRSGIAICSLQQCVEELVLNSIDAEATCIAVKVDVEACKLLVLDNGVGIDRQDFDRIGNRYSTSKCSSLKDLENLTYYGFRGEAVASIASLSDAVEITSRTKCSRKTYRKVFDNGQSKGVFEAETERPSVGTTVTVSNLFRNMPVRKKRLDPVLEMERIRQRVEAISLMHPSVSFTVMNECTGTMQVQLSKVKSTYYRFAQIHGLEKAKKLKEVTHSCGRFEITGHIGCEGHYNNSLQYLFLNRRLLLRTRLHKQLKYILSKSAISNKLHCSPSVSQAATSFSPKDSVGGGQLYGMYVINISCGYSEYDICLEPAKTLVEFKDWDSLSMCLDEGVRTFLAREGLLRASLEGSQSPPFPRQQHAAFSDVCENSKSPLDFVGEKAMASKPVHRKVPANVTEACGDSKMCGADVTESEQDAAAVEHEADVEMVSSDTVTTLHSDEQSVVTPVCEKASPIKPSTLMKISLFRREKPEPSICFPSLQQNTAGETQTPSERKSNKIKKISVATKLSSLKQAKMKQCDSTKHLLHEKKSNDRKKIRLSLSSTTAMSYGEQGIDTLRQSCNSSNRNKESSSAMSYGEQGIDALRHSCNSSNRNKDSSSSLRQASHKFTEPSDVHSLFGHLCSSSSVTHNPSAKAQTTASKGMTYDFSIKQRVTTSGDLDINHNLCMKGLHTTSKDLNIAHTNSERGQPTTSKNLNLSHDLSIKEQPASSNAHSIEERPRTSEDLYNEEPCTTSEDINTSHSLSIKEQHTAIKDPDVTHDVCDDTSIHTPWTSSSEDIFKEPEEICHPPAISSKRLDRTETQRDTNQVQEKEDDFETLMGDSWRSHYDHVAGKVVYINKKTGLSRYDAPTEDLCVEGVRAHPVQAKAVLPFLYQPRTSRALGTGTAEKADGESTRNLAEPFAAWKNPVFIHPDDVSMNVTSGDVGRVNSLMLPYRFTKDMIHSMKVIDQVDKKFLACLINPGDQGMCFYSKTERCQANLLVLVDQHAAHERVRLEGLVAESYEEDPEQPEQRKLVSSAVSPPLEVAITQEDLILLRSRQPFLCLLGLEVEFPSGDSRPRVLLHRVPTCFLEKESTRLKRGRPSGIHALIEEYLREQIQMLRSTSRLQATLPLTVHNVLASQACHGAIKFNHSLSRDECHSLVRSLADCQLPFQCAHGRPSIAPIVDLQHLEKDQQDTSKPNLRRLTRMYSSWLDRKSINEEKYKYKEKS